MVTDKWGKEGLGYAKLDNYEVQSSPEELLGYIAMEVREESTCTFTRAQQGSRDDNGPEEILLWWTFFLILEPEQHSHTSTIGGREKNSNR